MAGVECNFYERIYKWAIYIILNCILTIIKHLIAFQLFQTTQKSENVATPSPVTAAHNTSIYEPDPPDDAQDPPVFAPPKTEKYDTKNLEKLYTPSPVDKTSKKWGFKITRC